MFFKTVNDGVDDVFFPPLMYKLLLFSVLLILFCNFDTSLVATRVFAGMSSEKHRLIILN